MNLTREEILSKFDLGEYLQSKGVEFKGRSGAGSKLCLTACCPFHEDKLPSFNYWPEIQGWRCHAGCGSGSIVDAMVKFENLSEGDAFKQVAQKAEQMINGVNLPNQKPKNESPQPPKREVASYDYLDEFSNVVYQSIRYEPKSFSQAKIVGGKRIASMDGVKRVLYRLPQLLTGNPVWIVEGEKDADNLTELGFCATCNVGGANKWLDSYTSDLAGKDVVICGDNDEPGQKHVRLVFDSIAGKVASTRLVKVPAPCKDISDYIATFGLKENEAEVAVRKLYEQAPIFMRGINLPLYTLAELEPAYIEYVQKIDQSSFSLGSWLPSLRSSVRRIVPGELVGILADTGTGKTALLQNLSLQASNLNTVMFELELPATLMFERYVAMDRDMRCADVEQGYRDGERFGSVLRRRDNILICPDSRLDLIQIEDLINKSELKFGARPQLVLIDYIGLLGGKSRSRYEKMSDIAEGLKVMAKATNTIVIFASQIHRREDADPEIFLHDGKDSGSIENSAGLIIGAWRDPDSASLLKLKVLKNTKGRPGLTIDCNFDGQKMIITERSKFDDVPQPNQSNLIDNGEPPND